MRVLITGGSGFIGSYFIPLFRAAGHEVTILDLVVPRFDASDLRVVQGDVCDPAAVGQAMEGCDAMLHLAAAHHDFGISDSHYFKVNEGGAKNLCAAMTARGIRMACFYSTVAVFGGAPEPRTEVTVPQPLSPYGKSKLAGERVFEAWTRDGEGRSCLVIRPTVTFGPRNFANMYSLIRQIRSGKFMPIGSGKNVKSLSYVENIVDATLFLWNLGGPAPAENFRVFNYIDKPDLTSREIVDCCYRGLGKKPPGFNVPLPLAILLGLPFDLVIAMTGKNLPISTARMKKLCTQTKFEAEKARAAGFVPRYSLSEGIDRMVKWYVAEGQYQKPTGPVSSE